MKLNDFILKFNKESNIKLNNEGKFYIIGNHVNLRFAVEEVEHYNYDYDKNRYRIVYNVCYNHEKTENYVCFYISDLIHKLEEIKNFTEKIEELENKRPF
jgi:hypothetical protein